jgi:triacylglycerol esterase/lipase EstA (alpha/beta hydrolase family)
VLTQAIIIGHSMGNLVTRYFLERMGGADVSLMHIAVAAPFKGAPSSLQALLLGGTILNYGLAWRTMNSGAALWT